jgi:hypothetical protein
MIIAVTGGGELVVTVRSYSSVIVPSASARLEPPAMSTLPLRNSVAVCASWPIIKGVVAVQVSVVGSYNSAVVVKVLTACSPPPASRTLPPGSNVAV